MFRKLRSQLLFTFVLLIAIGRCPGALGDALSTGRCPSLWNDASEAGGMFRPDCVCHDDDECIYVGDTLGLLQYDGEHWRRVFQGDQVNELAYAHGNLYGALRTQVGKWSQDSKRQFTFTSFRTQIESQGCRSAGAFRDISVVGSTVYATKTGTIVRMRLRPDGTDDVAVFNAKTYLPAQYKYRRVRSVNGRPMVQLEDQKNPFRCTFAWLNEDGHVGEIITPVLDDGNEFPLHIVDFVEFAPGSERILVLAVSRNNSIKYRGGLFLANGKHIERFEVAGFEDSDLCGNSMNHLTRLDHGHFVVSTFYRGVFVIDSNRKPIYRIKPEECPGGRCRVHCDQRQRLWVTSQVSVCSFDYRSPVRIWQFPTGTIVSGFTQFKGDFIVSNTDSMYRAAISPEHHTPLEEFEQLPDSFQYAKCIESVGDQMLIGTRAGLYVTDDVSSLSKAKLISKTSYINGIARGHNDRYIYAYCRSIGVERYDRTGDDWKRTQTLVPKSTVHSWIVDHENYGWAASEDVNDQWQVHRIPLTDPKQTPDAKQAPDAKKPQAGKQTPDAKQPQAGKQPEQSLPGQMYRFAGCPFMLGQSPYLLARADSDAASDRDRERGFAVLRYDPQQNQFVTEPDLTSALHTNSNLKLPPISWLTTATSADGAAFITGSEMEIMQILPDRQVSRLCSTPVRGHPNHIVATPDGLVWIGVGNFLVCTQRHFDADPGTVDQLTGTVRISRVALTGTEQPGQTETKATLLDAITQAPLQLRYSRRSLDIEFSVPSTAFAEGTMYQFRMLGITDEWSDPSLQTIQQFPNLREGTYRFEVRARLPGGRMTPITSRSFRVLPPWYRTITFHTFCAMSIACIVWLYVRWRLRVNQRLVSELQHEVHVRVQAEKQLRDTQNLLLKQERMRAFGEMAAGVAHDVNNALSPVIVYTELIELISSLPENVRKMASSARQAANDAAGIIRRIQPFYRGGRDDSSINISTLVKEVHEAATLVSKKKRYANKHITFRCQVDEVELLVPGTPARQVLLNLVYNAMDAIEERGTVELKCLDQDDSVLLVVQDDGMGMSPEVLKSCFSSFYSTKAEYGSGLGLPSARSIVQSYGGSIEVTSNLGEGSKFCVWLPKTLANQTMRTETFIKDSTPVSGRVLLVEDIQSTREAVCVLLEYLGQQVVDVANAKQAMDELERDSFSLVITDYALHGETGASLCKAIRKNERFADLPLVIMSGNEDPGVLEVCDAFLSKPISLAELKRVLLLVQQPANVIDNVPG